MRIAIVGATGTLGRPTADLLEGEGHEVRRLSRGSKSFPLDLTTGTGLERALGGVEVVVSAANITNTVTPNKGNSVLVDGTMKLLQATDAHHVCISIVGIDQVPLAYYHTKLEQEQLVKDSGRPFTILRATQVHDLVGKPLRMLTRARIQLRSEIKLQTVDTADVAAAIAAVVTTPATGETVTVTGPQIQTLTEMRVGPGIPVPVPLPAKFRRPLLAGALTEPEPTYRGTGTFRQWLTRTAT